MMSQLLGHHSVVKEFDEAKATTIQGTITKVEWINPHVWLYMDVKNLNGSITNWSIEIASPNTLFRASINPLTIQTGKSYSVEIWPARNGSSKANGRKITLGDGSVLNISDKFPGAYLPQ
jgi:hypothetical protein